MRTRESDLTAGLGDNTIPAGYPGKKHGVGTAVQVGTPNPEARLAAETAAITPNGIDPFNKGFSIGGADDPLAEYEVATTNPSGMCIGGGNPTKPINFPGHPPMASTEFKEDEFDEYGAYESSIPFGENNPFMENDPIAENDLYDSFTMSDNIGLPEDDEVISDSLDTIPEFEDPALDPAIAELPVAADGVIEPVVVVTQDSIVDPDLGPIPDVILPNEEPIIEIDENDTDIQIPENVFETETSLPEAIPVTESFKLPEDQRLVVTKGDSIYLLGKVKEDLIPKWSKHPFVRAVESLCESKQVKAGFAIDGRHNKVAQIGRTVIVEVAKDWRLPGSEIIFERNDLLQIISAKPITEGEEVDEDEEKKVAKKETNKAKESDEEKAKREYYFAKKRWEEAKAKRSEDDDDDEEKKKAKEKQKQEERMLERIKTNNWL